MKEGARFGIGPEIVKQVCGAAAQGLHAGDVHHPIVVEVRKELVAVSQYWNRPVVELLPTDAKRQVEPLPKRRLMDDDAAPVMLAA